MHLPKIEIDPRAEETAKNGIHYQRREEVWMLPRQANVSNSELGLRCLRLVHDVNLSHSRARRCCQLRLLGRPCRPVLKRASNHRSRTLGSHVSSENYSRTSRPVVRAVKLLY